MNEVIKLQIKAEIILKMTNFWENFENTFNLNQARLMVDWETQQTHLFC